MRSLSKSKFGRSGQPQRNKVLVKYLNDHVEVIGFCGADDDSMFDARLEAERLPGVVAVKIVPNTPDPRRTNGEPQKQS